MIWRVLYITRDAGCTREGALAVCTRIWGQSGTGCDAAGFTYTGEEASWHVVHPHPMSSYVADWKDVVSTLRGTRFERFLAMDGSSAG